MSNILQHPALFELPKIERYSIAVCPPDDVVQRVTDYKQALSRAIGRGYPSLNAAAHISFSRFDADTDMLEPIERYLENFCRTLNPFDVHISGTANFPIGTFYLDVERPSRDTLRSLMATVNNSLFRKNLDSDSYVPHMSIAKNGLTKGELAVAKETIKDVDFKFVCDNIAIRKFDNVKRQYDVYKRFYFGDQPSV